MADHRTSESAQVATVYSTVKLADGGGSIRVLDILPDRREAEIRVELRVVDLRLSPYYEALSYTWGSTTATKCIAINEEYKLAVTNNLFNALHGLRKRIGKRTLWVDQVCINQSNTEERSDQVAQMGRIFQKAALVNAWLGVPRSELTMTLRPFLKLDVVLKMLYKFIGATRDFDLENAFGIAQQWERLQVACERLRAFKSALLNDAAIIGWVLRTYNDPLDYDRNSWISRAWIRQEFLLARRIYFCCGHKRWRYSMAWFTQMQSYQYLGNLYAQQALRCMEEYRRHLKSARKCGQSQVDDGRSKNFIDQNGIGIYRAMMSAFPDDVDATDPRDHVYSLLGIIGTAEAGLIGCDYNLSCAQIYARATFASIKMRNNFDIFDFIGGERFTDSLPTWAVDFARPKRPPVRYVQLHKSLLAHLETCVIVGGVKRISAGVNYDPLRGHLTITGSNLDTVVDTLFVKLGGGSPPDQHVLEQTAILEKTAKFIRDVVAAMTLTQQNSNLAVLMKAFGLLPRSCNPWIDSALASWVATRISKTPEVVFVTLMKAFELWTYLRVSSERKEVRKVGIELEQRFHSESGGGFLELCYKVLEYPRGEVQLSLFATSAGAIGMGPTSVAKGDTIVLIRSHRPFIALRRSGSEYTLQGQVFVYPFLDENFLTTWESLNIEQEQFVLR